jgi:predicted DNA-binding antitoxin AbrB/MazE fold protein
VEENLMGQTITAVYENGVLRPLKPLALPEHAQVELDIRPLVTPADATAQREQVRRALADAGLLASITPSHEQKLPLSAHERSALALALAESGVAPLSIAILEEREGE